MARKDKGAKTAKKPKEKDVLARLLGAAAGLPLLTIACYLLLRGTITLTQAGQLAGGALLLALLTEKAVVPLGRFLIGPPRE